MRLQALTVAAQVVAALMLLGISLVAISVLEKADDVLASASVQRADRPAIADARQSAGGAVGLVAIVAGSGLLALLLLLTVPSQPPARKPGSVDKAPGSVCGDLSHGRCLSCRDSDTPYYILSLIL